MENTAQLNGVTPPTTDIETVEFCEFYTQEIKKDGSQTVSIQPLMLVQLLRKLGFRRMDLGDKSVIIRVSENVIEETNETQIVDQFEEYILNWPDYFPDGTVTDMIRNKLYNGLARFFQPKLLYRLNLEPDLNIQNHTKEKAFFYYQNGFVEVTADSVEMKPYTALTGKVWKDQILDRKFKLVPDFEESNFAKYVSNISNNWKVRWFDGQTNPDRSPKRYQQFKQIIGNGLHSYTVGKMRAVVFTDSRTDDEASGRTGKTLIMKAMGEMLNAHQYAKTFVEVNGKDFDANDRFKWQEMGIDTRLVHLNDAATSLSFEDLFNDITEGFKCQKKNEAPFVVHAKMYLSTNRTIRLHGDSAKDRSLEFEMADYYGADNGPDREFGEWFFRDWDDAAWNKFDNFMIHCCQLYLRHGMEAPETINLEARKMKEETCHELVDFMDYRYQQIGGEEHDLQTLRDEFEEDNPDFRKHKWFSQRTFNKWVKLYAQYHPKIKDCNIRKTNSKQMVQFTLCDTVKPIPKAEPEWFE